MRKRKPRQRVLQADPRYGDPLVSKFVNNLMVEGKKSLSYSIFYGAMDEIASRVEDESPHELWKKAINNVMPQVEVRSRRIGGATFQIPTEIQANRKMFLAMTWLIKYSRERADKGMISKLASEVISASKGEGAAVKRKEEMHRMAEANRAFAHFRI